MISITIVHLPGGRWLLEVNGVQSATADYSERIMMPFHHPGGIGFIAQTEYYGDEKVWPYSPPITHETRDQTL